MKKLALSLFLVSCGDPGSPCGVCDAPKTCARVEYTQPCVVFGMQRDCPVVGHMCISKDKVIKLEVTEE